MQSERGLEVSRTELGRAIRSVLQRKQNAWLGLLGGAALIGVNPVIAQETSSPDELDEIVVTGLRGSLKASMTTKRDAVGVVDAINAEDIGKFPDSNLSESLQRITGISISRRNGEGALITARGFGCEYNMVTLNGRMMPAADAFVGATPGANRAFNFANLASETISAIEVYKTSKAEHRDRWHRRHGQHADGAAARRRQRFSRQLRHQSRQRHHGGLARTSIPSCPASSAGRTTTSASASG